MAGNTKEIRTRIKSVSSTRQLTRAMELVASSKIRRASERMMQSRQYREALLDTVGYLASLKDCEKSPYLAEREEKGDLAVIIAGDRGLAGGYNANLFREAAQYPDVKWLALGKRACERYGAAVNSSEHFSFKEAQSLAREICESFQKGELRRFGILSTRYVSAMEQQPELRWILPPEKKPAKGNAVPIFEPDPNTVLENMMQEYVAGMLTAAAREAFACEVNARRTAMDSAGKNATEMIDRLQLEYNRARQGAITREITEIVAGSAEE